ncbi:MAG: type II toxin-antitoxin system HicB family antitoxin [Dehalococcoidia bacterium]|nr:type II toxin-antitoxin system HicB family antitoxin [Dehalococcoidia bacterium]
MEVTVLVYEAEEGGYWAHVAEMPGCFSSGETLDELRANVVEAMEAWLLNDDGESPAVYEPIARWQVPVPKSALQPAG